jgi:alpha-1,2-mannosyltransferase
MSAHVPAASRFVQWLTPRRLTAQAWILLVCLWPVAILDFSTSGVMDRAGNVKFQDFVQFYVGGTLVRGGRTASLYDWRTALAMMHEIAPQWKFGLPMVYGPQVEALFVPLSRFSFLMAAAIWVAISVGVYLACCYLLWRSCPALAPYSSLFWPLVLAYPAFFHYVIRGQISPLMLVCFTAGWFAFRADRPLLAGLVLGCLAFKPQFLVAIPIVFLLARAWKPLVGTVVGAAGQLALTWAWCGTEVMRQYLWTLANLSRLVAATETTKAHAQMHSLRSFFSLLAPCPNVALGFTLITTVIIMVLAARTWRSDLPLPVRFSALIVALVLVNPHLFVYDLLVLVPALILLAEWILNERIPEPPVRNVLACCLYGAYLLPLFGPLTMITHLQLSVLALVWLQWELWRASKVRVPCLSA